MLPLNVVLTLHLYTEFRFPRAAHSVQIYISAKIVIEVCGEFILSICLFELVFVTFELSHVVKHCFCELLKLCFMLFFLL